MARRIELGRLSLTYISLCFKETGISKNKGNWNFVPISGLRKFRYGTSIVATGWTLIVINGRR